MRIFIITDSLGLPRKGVSYENTWTDKLLNVLQGRGTNQVIAYTMLRRCLTVKEIYEEKSKFGIGYLHPDLIIFQFGVVDSARRVIPLWLENLIPNQERTVRRFIGKHRYQLTKLYNLHYNSPKKFKYYLQLLIDWLEQRPRSYAFIKIAPPGDFLLARIYNIQNDIALYNDILIDTVREYGPHGTVLDPYDGYAVEEFILEEDGHHLNPVGEQLVFNTVYNWISQSKFLELL